MRVVEENAVLFTQVLKSFEVLPNAMTSVSYGSLRSATSSSPFIAQLAEGDGFPSRLISTTEPSWNWKPWFAGMGQIAQRINAFIQRTGGHFVQQQLPQMAVVTVHEVIFAFLWRPNFLPS